MQSPVHSIYLISLSINLKAWIFVAAIERLGFFFQTLGLHDASSHAHRQALSTMCIKLTGKQM